MLLGALAERARLAGWIPLEAEISTDTAFAPRVAQLVRRALLELAPKERWRDRLRRAAGALQSFSVTIAPDGSVTGSIDVGPLEGVADSGDLGEDLTDLLVALGEAAREHDSGIAFLLDEVRFLQRRVEACIRALHRSPSSSSRSILVGAGLPHLPRLAGEARSYAERLFVFRTLGPLSVPEAVDALVKPAEELSVAFEDRAIDVVITYTEGYPYFIQEYGKVVWDRAAGSPIAAIEAVEAQAIVEARLDASFFEVRVQRASEHEVTYMRAMAELGPGSWRATDVARVLGRSIPSQGTIRARLIEKGLLYSPSYGHAAFTVPQFDRIPAPPLPLARGQGLTDGSAGPIGERSGMAPTDTPTGNVAERAVRRIDAFQQTHRPLAFPFAVVKKFGDDRGGQLAALMSYYAFLSLFPLLAAASTLLALALPDRPELRARVLDSALRNLPIVGPTLRSDGPALDGAGVALAVAIALAIWAGLGAVKAFEHACDTVWNVPYRRRPNFVGSLARSTGLLVVAGALIVAGAAAAAVAQVAPG